ncbi:MAG TPA: class I SAM-dependent methyltransferase [Flavobacteriaceae bacterium]|jgi:SAM-dependent methyltransferase|nr:class I SAM-dependent methyltransferase [Flavobacteriaceae bacterium]
MSKLDIKDVIGWDVINWSKALKYWENKVDLKNKEYNCLELGARSGGLSLWLACQGNNVICSDLYSPKETAKQIHNKYSISHRITYSSLNATEINCKNEYDIVAFKSILGGINNSDNENLKEKVVSEIYQSLKPSGKLLFIENLEATGFHRFMRNRFVKWSGGWNYLKFSEIEPLFKDFKKVNYYTVGFFGTFGRNEIQREYLGKIDNILGIIIPKKYRYVVFGIAEK